MADQSQTEKSVVYNWNDIRKRISEALVKDYESTHNCDFAQFKSYEDAFTQLLPYHVFDVNLPAERIEPQRREWAEKISKSSVDLHERSMEMCDRISTVMQAEEDRGVGTEVHLALEKALYEQERRELQHIMEAENIRRHQENAARAIAQREEQLRIQAEQRLAAANAAKLSSYSMPVGYPPAAYARPNPQPHSVMYAIDPTQQQQPFPGN